MPKVSFVCPIYDGDSYAAETIESMRRQTMKDIEIIVIDDCSPDYTPELMDWYVKTDPRIKYHRFETNQGVCEARNYGNKMAESEIICVTDQDDLSTHWRAEYAWQFFKKHPEINCLTSSYWELKVDGKKHKKYVPTEVMNYEMLNNYGNETWVWMHSSACYRKEDILKLPYRNKDGQTDDYVFLEDWTQAGMKFATTKVVLANCRRLPWSVMNQRRLVTGNQPSYIL